ncbi:MAG: hypothetical protein ACLFQS_00525 [Bacteroidales bacterium]
MPYFSSTDFMMANISGQGMQSNEPSLIKVSKIYTLSYSNDSANLA